MSAGFLTRARLDEAIAILGKHSSTRDACAELSRTWRHNVSETRLRERLRQEGLLSPGAYLAASRWEAPPTAQPQTAAAAVDFDIDVQPPVVDPVARKDREDREARLRRENADLIDRVRDLETRQKFVAKLGAHNTPPRIMPRERTSGIREMTAIVACSDFHVEEPVDPISVGGCNEYSLEIADRRIKRLFNAVVWNVEHHRASGRIAIRDLVLWLGGDLYSGYIHEELVENNSLSPTETVLWLVPRIRDGIATLLDVLQLDRLVVPCSIGNHGRTTMKPRISTGYANSFDWLLYHWLRDTFAGDKRVVFEITPSAHQYVQVYDDAIHFHHGDDVRYQGGVGGLAIPLLKAVPAWERVKSASLHVIGHHHTLRDFGRAVSNGSLIGYGPYSQRIRAEFEPPQQAMFFWDRARKKTLMTPLWVEESARSDGGAGSHSHATKTHAA